MYSHSINVLSTSIPCNMFCQLAIARSKKWRKPERELLRVVEALRFVEGLGERPRPLGCTVSLAILSLDISLDNPVADTFGGGLFGV